MIEDKTICESIRWNAEKSKFMIFRVTRTYNIDEIRQTRLSKTPIAKTITWHELSELPESEKLYKKLTIPILILKKVTDRESLETLEGYFSQNLEVSILSDSVYEHKYLKLCEGRIMVVDLNEDWTMPLVLSGGNHVSGIQSGVKKFFLGEPKRITDNEAIALKQKGSPCFQKEGNEFSISLGTFKDLNS